MNGISAAKFFGVKVTELKEADFFYLHWKLEKKFNSVLLCIGCKVLPISFNKKCLLFTVENTNNSKGLASDRNELKCSSFLFYVA